jgi:HTH-type transcriptional regulator/antitoxin HigA
MAKTPTYTYTPDYAVSPGEILEETLNVRRVKRSDLAALCNLSAKNICQILSAKAPVTLPTALCLENVTEIPSRTWIKLEANYRLHRHLCKRGDHPQPNMERTVFPRR